MLINTFGVKNSPVLRMKAVVGIELRTTTAESCCLYAFHISQNR